jgi:hypothetical protein
MRQPAIDPAPALRSLIAAIPDDRLRELVLEILTAPARVTKPPAIVAKRFGGWPLGKKRGRPRKTTTTKAAKARAKRAAADAKTSAAKVNGADGADPRERRRERDRARHAAKAAAIGPAGGAAAAAEAASAKTLWQHAEKLQPKAPWRAVVREFGINEAVALDAHRIHKLPPGIAADAVARFLAVPVG